MTDGDRAAVDVEFGLVDAELARARHDLRAEGFVDRELLRDLGRLRALGRPILLGTSRKSTIGKVLDLPAEERVEGTLATTALGQLQILDPAALESLLGTLLDRLKTEIDSLPEFGFGNWLGMIVTGLMRGSNLRLDASSVGSVMQGPPGIPVPGAPNAVARAPASAGSTPPDTIGWPGKSP